MKRIIFLPAFLAIFAGFFFFVSDRPAAQTIEGVTATGKPVKTGLLGRTIGTKASGGGFRIVRLSDLDPSGSSSVAGDPCDVAQRIEFGQEIAGSLANTDCELDDGSYADFYTFDALAGERATIRMGSGSFDSYLGLANLSGTYTVEDDDSGGGTNAYIDVTLPETGTYVILANSAFPDSFGSYIVSLEGGPNCTFAFTPDFANIPAAGGNFSFQLATQPRCYWRAGSLYGEVTTTSVGLGSGTVNYTVAPNPVNQDRVMSIGVRNNYFNMRQAALFCTYTFSPTSISIGSGQTTGSFNVSTQTGCFWSAQPNGSFFTATGWANGNGSVTYTASQNNGGPRSGEIRVGSVDQYQSITITQAGMNCTYSVTPTSLNVPASGATGNYVVNTQPGCTWVVSNSTTWIQFQPPGLGNGPAAIPYVIQANTGRNARSGAFQFSSVGESGNTSVNTWVDQAGRLGGTVADFDGDAKTDLSIYRPSVGQWWLSRSSDGGNRVYQFGVSTDKVVAADYTGDGKSDVAFFRPSTAEWFILRSDDFSFYSFPFGGNGDVPAPADYDGDGKADPAVFRESNLTWYISKSTGGTQITGFGSAGDLAVPADYDGDGKADIAIFRPGSVGGAQWWILRSSTGTAIALQFGASTDKTVVGDYTGDGKADVALFRPSTATWSILRSEDFSFYGFPFGASTDVPSPGDYDGDGKFDAAVFRPSNTTWYANRSTAGVLIQQYGASGDQPLPSAYVR